VAESYKIVAARVKLTLISRGAQVKVADQCQQQQLSRRRVAAQSIDHIARLQLEPKSRLREE
ncbi:MAG: hypothetical protein WCA48_26570, partial [Pseudomonas gingeri]